MITIAKLLWTNEELKSHLIVANSKWRKDATTRTAFESEEDLKKISMVSVYGVNMT
jgi:hypothetical protein